MNSGAKWGRWFPISFTALKAQPITAGDKWRPSQWAEGLESMWEYALFTCTATALRPPQSKGLRFHQCRLVSNLLLMATLHPLLFSDLLDSIIVPYNKGYFQGSHSKWGTGGVCESGGGGGAFQGLWPTSVCKYINTSLHCNSMSLCNTKPEAVMRIIRRVKGRSPCKINFHVATSS